MTAPVEPGWGTEACKDTSVSKWRVASGNPRVVHLIQNSTLADGPENNYLVGVELMSPMLLLALLPKA